MHLAIIRSVMLHGSECVLVKCSNSKNKCVRDDNADEVMYIFSKLFLFFFCYGFISN